MLWEVGRGDKWINILIIERKLQGFYSYIDADVRNVVKRRAGSLLEQKRIEGRQIANGNARKARQ